MKAGGESNCHFTGGDRKTGSVIIRPAEVEYSLIVFMSCSSAKYVCREFLCLSRVLKSPHFDH